MNNYKDKPIWVCWRLEPGKDGKPTKIPYNPATGGKAQSNNPTTWGTYEQASAAMERKGYSGVGFMFAKLDGEYALCGIDIDVKDDKPHLSPEEITELLTHMQTYSELSPSGNGHHIMFLLDLSKLPEDYKQGYYQKNPGNGLEAYIATVTNRFFTYTGEAVNSEDVEERTPQFLEFLDRYMQKKKGKNKPSTSQPASIGMDGKGNIGIDKSIQDLISIARAAKNGDRFSALFDRGDISLYNNDHSAADLALANIIGFYSQGDTNRAEEMFSMSALGQRDKWKTRADYRAATIAEGIDKCGGKFYKPRKTQAKKNALPLPVNHWPGANYFVPFDTDVKRHRYRFDDIGFGNVFADTFKNVARWVPEAKTWYVYDGRVWKIDLGGATVAQMAKDLMDYLLDLRREYAKVFGDDSAQTYAEIMTSRRKKRHRDQMLADAATVYPISILEFDKDPMIFNCQNCTLNLKTFRRHNHRPDDFLSKISNVVHDTAARCDRWGTFITEIMQNDDEKAKFLQKALGYALTGDTSSECFFILYGATTRNGKGVTMETMRHLMGDYGRGAQPETIAQKTNPNSSAPSEDIARLKGVRFVNMSEPDKGLRLNAALVKQVTGGDVVTARFLHQNSFDFIPEFKLFINTNFLPRVTDDTVFASGRVKLIPFERHFQPHEQDPGLKTFFKEPVNVSGIFNWIIAGLKLMQSEGLKQPDAVTNATAQYRDDSDMVGQFVKDCLVAVHNKSTLLKDVHTEFIAWCDDNGIKYPMASKGLADELRRRGITVERAGRNKSYVFDYGIVAADTA